MVDFIELATTNETMDLLMEEIEVKDGSRLAGKEQRIPESVETRASS